jgi:hypothetical protein
MACILRQSTGASSFHAAKRYADAVSGLVLPLVAPTLRSDDSGNLVAGAGRRAKDSLRRLDMVTALEAVGPHPSLGDQAKVFGRFVGTWDVKYMARDLD